MDSNFLHLVNFYKDQKGHGKWNPMSILLTCSTMKSLSGNVIAQVVMTYEKDNFPF